ncbi:hypothetical protein B0H10DRAFT_1810991 [Mycena sp. CBHHK59/15]|nr:hypothetical protein B0H10DRAFT_1810991 [Mycena sp. CBHHK59/15]
MDASNADVDEWEDEVRQGFLGDRLKTVDTTGIFSRHIRWCECMNHEMEVVPQDLQLLHAHFYPATSDRTSDRPSTAFTFNVLEEFAIDALECKTAALTFLSKLRRQTDRVFPLSTANVYAAFMRCSRQWRSLMNLKRAGIAHDNRTRSPGDLALFCVSCLQPGKNVTIEEVKLSADFKLYRPQIVVDGNFKLENLKMRNPEDDVRLSDGQMFFVGSVLYDEHVRITPEQKHRSNCNNHRAVNETNVKRKEVDSTGIGACACARHGFFRQLPPEIKQMFLMYDISCQSVLRWILRFKEGKYLFYRKDLELFAAVGKFHLGAHILECFWEFSLNFMEGSGQVDDEILETLWAALDKVVGSTRSMSCAHRQEVLDDYMNDSNWKKMVGSGE